MSGSARQRELERRIFTQFLDVEPRFKERVARGWTQPAEDPPDVLFDDTDGRRVGVEMKAWINEEQIADAKKREAIEQRFLAALEAQPKNPNRAVSFVWLFRATDRAPGGADAERFRDELLSLIEERDREWSAREHRPQQGETVNDFGNRPTLKRFLSGVSFFPRELIDPGGQDWIAFPLRGGAYDDRMMLEPLQDLLSEAREKYRHAKRDRGIERLVLLIHYDGRAWQYNTPIDAPDWGFDLFVSEARFFVFALDELSEEPPPWDEIVLFNAVAGRSAVVFPQA